MSRSTGTELEENDLKGERLNVLYELYSKAGRGRKSKKRYSCIPAEWTAVLLYLRVIAGTV